MKNVLYYNYYKYMRLCADLLLCVGKIIIRNKR